MTEIQFYKKALRDYRISYWFPFLKTFLNTQYGFCLYFRRILDKRGMHTQLIYEVMPTLFDKYKPEIYFKITYYWYKPGSIKPRIKLLKKIIGILKEGKERIGTGDIILHPKGAAMVFFRPYLHGEVELRPMHHNVDLGGGYGMVIRINIQEAEKYKMISKANSSSTQNLLGINC